MLITDWYGRDDESDKTGRIWRLKYIGKDAPIIKHRLDAKWTDAGAVEVRWSSPHHLVRGKAIEQLLRGAQEPLRSLRIMGHAMKSSEPLGAANALWVLARLPNGPKQTLIGGTEHPDGRVRRLAVELAHRYRADTVIDIARALAKDKDPAVRVAAALALDTPTATRAALLDALRFGAAQDPYLRYEAAWHLARSTPTLIP